MRPDPFDTGRVRYNHARGDDPRRAGADARSDEPSTEQTPPSASPPSGPALPSFDDWRASPGGGDTMQPLPPRRRGRGRWWWISRGIAAAIVLFVVAILWLAVTAPLSQSLKPPTPPSITLLDRNGDPVARRGAVIGAPVDAAKLPAHVREAFMAIEDRRFYSHWGVDPRGIARAAWHNMRGGGVREGGSTITQQLAKNAFLDADRTAGRKLREAMIAFWLEAWLTKDEILSRYLSNVYFGDNVYGIRAAADHYFGRKPENLSIGQAAMLAGLVKAPSRLAPTSNLEGARKRQAVVVGAMVDAGFLTTAQAADIQPQRVRASAPETVPSGTYFADWVLPEARDQAGEIRDEAKVKTTLDRRLQRAAEGAVRRAGLKQAQVALVAMKPDGEVLAMVGGRDYAKSPFNRATQARRQPGSTFKLFVYMAALRAGMTPDSTVEDRPVEISGWKPKNADGRYLGTITLRQAFARSSNVAAARLTQQVGPRAVIKAARDLGISTPIADEATIGLGTSTVSLLELTAAYAAVANGHYPVQPRGLSDVAEKPWYSSLTGGQRDMPDAVHDGLLALLSASVGEGTGHGAALPVATYGKTGTTQDNRDALFVGFANGIVAGVWVGNDDNTPNPGLSGGGIPARIWRDFMANALNLAPPPAAAPRVVEGDDAEAATIPDFENAIPPITMPDTGVPVDRINEGLEGLGIDARLHSDGSVVLGGRNPPRQQSVQRDDRRAPDEREGDPVN